MASSSDNRTIAITSLGHCLCHMAELAFAAVIPAVMAEFSLTAERATSLAIPGLMMFGLAAPLAGFWADRRSYREALLGYYLLVAVAAMFIVFCSVSAWMLMVGLTLLGVAISIYHPVGMAMLSHCDGRGRAMGINGVAGSIGVAVGPSFAIFVGAWRLTYVLIAVSAVVGFIATAMLQPRIETTTPIEPQSSTKASHQMPQVRRPMLLLSLLFVAIAFGGFNYRTLVTALPSYLKSIADGPIGEELTAGSSKGATYVFIVLAMGGVGQLVGGYLADRLNAPKLYVATILCTVPCAYFLGMSSTSAGAWFAGALAVFMFAEQPLENTMIATVTPPKWRSTVYGLKFILAFGVASSGLYVAGKIWSDFGIQRVFVFFAGMAIVMASFASLFAWMHQRSVGDATVR